MNHILANVKRIVELDSVERQTLASEVSSMYGSLAFMYAKAVHQKTRTIESVNERMRPTVEEILAYVLENGYDLILE